MSWLTVSNLALLAFTFCTTVSSIAVYVLSQAAEREKDRAFDRYKLVADQKIAEAREGAEQAREGAAIARADAERAKLETARTNQRLAATQQQLDAANQVIPLSKSQVDRIVDEFKRLDLGGSQPVWGAANDRQAQHRLLQLTNAFLQADRRLYPSPTVGAMVAPAGEKGDFLVHYWSDDRRVLAERMRDIFRSVGLTSNAYKLPPEADENSRPATQHMVLIGVAARAVPQFSSQ